MRISIPCGNRPPCHRECCDVVGRTWQCVKRMSPSFVVVVVVVVVVVL